MTRATIPRTPRHRSKESTARGLLASLFIEDSFQKRLQLKQACRPAVCIEAEVTTQIPTTFLLTHFQYHFEVTDTVTSFCPGCTAFSFPGQARSLSSTTKVDQP